MEKQRYVGYSITCDIYKAYTNDDILYFGMYWDNYQKFKDY